MINLPFMNNAKAAINNHVDVQAKKDLAKADKGPHFEHVIQNEESASSSSSKNDGLVKNSSQNEAQSTSDQQTQGEGNNIEQSSDSSSDTETDTGLSDVAVDNQEQLNDINVISLNEVLSELTIGLSQTIETQKDNSQIDNEMSDLSIDMQSEIKNVVNDLSLLDQQIAQTEFHEEQTVQSSETGGVDLNLANVGIETTQITQSLNEIQAQDDQSLQVDDTVQDDKTLTQDIAEDESSSNYDNAINLKNFNYWQSNGVQESLNLKSDFEKKNHDHVVAIASKSLLEGMNPLALQKSQMESKVQAVDLRLQNVSNQQMSEMVDAKSVINQLYDGVRLGMKQEAQQIKINLDPPDWGNIQVRMNIVKSDVNLSVVTENQAVKEALDKGVAALRGQFMQNGLNLANVNIGVGGGGAEQAEREARERLADDERNQVKRLSKLPAGVAHGINLITTTTGVIDSHV